MKERRHQIQQMSDIYRQAERVIVWLGEGTDESDFDDGFHKRTTERTY